MGSVLGPAADGRNLPGSRAELKDGEPREDMHKWKNTYTDADERLALRHDESGRVVASVVTCRQGAQLVVEDADGVAKRHAYVSVAAAKRVCEKLFP